MKAFKAYSHFVCLNSKVNGELPGKSDSHSKAKIPDHTDSLLQQRKRIVQKDKKKKKIIRGRELLPIHYQKRFQKKHEGFSSEILFIQSTMLADAMNSCGK